MDTSEQMGFLWHIRASSLHLTEFAIVFHVLAVCNYSIVLQIVVFTFANYISFTFVF